MLVRKGFLHKSQVINRVSNFFQVINTSRAWNIADFGHKLDKGFGKQATHPLPIFLELIPRALQR